MDTVLRRRHQNGVPDHGFIRIFRKLMMFEHSQHPQNQKLCGKRSISTQKLVTKKNFFFTKHFFAIFFTFFDSSKSKKSRFGRSGDVSVPTITLSNAAGGNIFGGFAKSITHFYSSQNEFVNVFYAP